MDKIKPLVNDKVLKQESKTRWSRQRVPEIKASGIKHDEAGQSGPEDDDFHDLISDEPLARMWESILYNADAEQLGPGVGQLLIDQARATITMKRFVPSTQRTSVNRNNILTHIKTNLVFLGPWVKCGRDLLPI